MVVAVFRRVVLILPPGIQSKFLDQRTAGVGYDQIISMSHPASLQVDAVNERRLLPGGLETVRAAVLPCILLTL